MVVIGVCAAKGGVVRRQGGGHREVPQENPSSLCPNPFQTSPRALLAPSPASQRAARVSSAQRWSRPCRLEIDRRCVAWESRANVSDASVAAVQHEVTLTLIQMHTPAPQTTLHTLRCTHRTPPHPAQSQHHTPPESRTTTSGCEKRWVAEVHMGVVIRRGTLCVY